MKQLFFTAATICIPGAILSWIVWLFIKGVYTVTSDWRLERELKQIRAEAAQRPPKAVDAGVTGKVKPETDVAATMPVVSFPIDGPVGSVNRPAPAPTVAPTASESNPPTTTAPEPAAAQPAPPASDPASTTTYQEVDVASTNVTETSTQPPTPPPSGNPPPHNPPPAPPSPPEQQ